MGILFAAGSAADLSSSDFPLSGTSSHSAFGLGDCNRRPAELSFGRPDQIATSHSQFLQSEAKTAPNVTKAKARDNGNLFHIVPGPIGA